MELTVFGGNPFITASGAYDKIPYELHACNGELNEACRVVVSETKTIWVSGDYLAMRASEMLAGSLIIRNSWGESFTGNALEARAYAIINILDIKPGWRN